MSYPQNSLYIWVSILLFWCHEVTFWLSFHIAEIVLLCGIDPSNSSVPVWLCLDPYHISYSIPTLWRKHPAQLFTLAWHAHVWCYWGASQQIVPSWFLAQETANKCKPLRSARCSMIEKPLIKFSERFHNVCSEWVFSTPATWHMCMSKQFSRMFPS